MRLQLAAKVRLPYHIMGRGGRGGRRGRGAGGEGGGGGKGLGGLVGRMRRARGMWIWELCPGCVVLGWVGWREGVAGDDGGELVGGGGRVFICGVGCGGPPGAGGLLGM